ncbi:hypothetical protein [Streptomyces omiyaensis]|uniref:Lipoprotein n=1 Tax=Streptomyces omiyaensis TaxID=68247 RepID=A0ABW7BIK4_9ACTN|nr:hypothetical protein [Streptomyces omiyaensis]GGY28864.1 hypothetical protein GCM10010363_06420 [Streptomyces omiyaensis]
MRLSRLSAGKALRGATSGVVLCLLVAACGGSEEPEPERVRAEQQCDDTLSPDAARALETVLRTKRFDHDPRGGLQRSTDELIADYPKSEGRTQRRSLCKASPSTSSARVTVDFRFWRDINLHGDQHAATLHPYDMGVEALSGPDDAHLYVNCVSPRFPGSDKRPAKIWGALGVSRSELPDTVPVREATLTVLHSVTLAVVRKLGCENDAGLDAEPVFTPLPE